MGVAIPGKETLALTPTDSGASPLNHQPTDHTSDIRLPIAIKKEIQRKSALGHAEGLEAADAPGSSPARVGADFFWDVFR